ncbi:MAG: deoxynucleoside kinase [Bdellovibrionia bacterium]
MPNEKIFIAVAGNIGSGKTTLTTMLSEKFGWTPHFEVVQDNPYLADFYQDMARWAFPLQIFFLTHRFTAHRQVSQGTCSAIQDRSIYEDAHIFARNLYEQGVMQERDYRTYQELYQTLCGFLTPPDLVVYLKKSVPSLEKQIAKRARAYEQKIPTNYLTSLNDYYNDWMETYSLGKKLIIPSDDLDFLKNQNDFDSLSEQIFEALGQRDLFLTPERGKKRT